MMISCHLYMDKDALAASAEIVQMWRRDISIMPKSM